MKTIIEGIRRMLKPIQLTRTIILAAMLLLGGMTAKAQTYYIFQNGNNYLYNNDGTPGVTTSFTKYAVWYSANGNLPDNSNNNLRNLRSFPTSDRYLRGTNSNNSTGTVSIGATQSVWRLYNGYLTCRTNSRYYYVILNGTTVSLSTANNTNRFTPTTITVNPNAAAINPTVDITISGFSNGGIQLASSVTGSYAPACTTAVVNSTTYYWTDDTEASTTRPGQISDWSDATKTWAITIGGTYASVSSDGLVTITGNPTGNIVVTLTVSKGGYEGTQTFTLTRTHFDEDVSTTATITGLTVSPSTATLEYDESQAFTASATVNATTTTTAAYERLTNGGNNYYYYDGALHAATPTPVEEVTHPTPTYSWALSGTAATYLSLSMASGATTTATHSTGAQSNSNATLTVTATTPGASNSTATATITVVPTTATAIAGDNQTIYVGNGGTVTYTLTPAHAYDRVSATSGNTGVFTVDASPVSGGSVAITPVAPGQTTLTLVALKPDGTNGSSSTVTITVRNLVATPEISFALDGSDVKATLTCATGGATIKYTTDGSDPATSGTAQTYSGTPFTVTNGTTVKAYATGSNEYWDASATVTKVCTPLDYVEQGVSGNIATLNDLEDHTWSYYQASGNLPTGYPAELHSPDPRNIKITYKGNGQLTNGNAVTGVKVGVDADVHTFIYYKTLEKNSNDRYAYTTIPNPFSVRPTTGTGNSMVYYGFSHWKVISVSGGTIQGDPTTINAETEIEFNVTRDYTTNCQSMEVVLEAVWDVAEVSTNGTFTNNYGVERMFYVVPGGNTNLATANKACTYSSFYPNGTTNGQTEATLSDRVTRYAGFSATYDSKIEYIILRDYNNNSTLNANGKNFTIGRGVSGYNNGLCATYLYGLSENQSTGFKFRIESGSYGNLYFMGSETALTAGIQTAVMGCDYDRANNEDNTKLSVTTDITVAYSATLGSSNNKGAEIFNCTVKSGNFDLGTSNYAGSNQFYLSNWGSNNYIYGKRKMTVEGGIFSDIAGGMDDDGTETVTMVEIRIKGGTMNSVVYGAAQRSDAQGHRIMIITGGLFKGWIAGGANGNSNQNNSNGEMTGNTYIYVGGNAEVNSNGSTSPLNRALGGNVFGAGCGYGSNYSSGLVTGNTNVVIADNAYIERGVYGGGSYGYTTQTANIYILGGHVEGKNGGVSGTSYSESITGGVFGGACQNQGGTVNITMTDGLVEGGVYGGSNATGTLSGSVTMKINGGQVGTSSVNANVHGGGFGSNTRVSQNVTVNIGNGCDATSGVTVYGDVYGGSAEGYVNGTTVTNAYTTKVNLYKGTIYGSLYGGGLGTTSPNHPANVYGDVAVKVYGGSVKKTDANGANGSGGVYGCNNINGAPQRAVSVDIYGTDPAPSGDEYALFAVYGGGNQANYSYSTPTVKVHNCDNSIEYVYGGGNAAHITNGNTDVTIYGGNKIGNVFGGGNGTVTAANVSGNTNVKIYGGTILRVFGGSNTNGTIGGSININVQSQQEAGNDPCSGDAYVRCPLDVDELYGGGNFANITGNVVTTIECSDDMEIHNLYGGCNQANITGNVVLNVEGGIYQYVYGGSKGNAETPADISGTVTLNLYGGTIENVFGGSNINGNIGGSITVNVLDIESSTCPLYITNIYGGSNLTSYTPNYTPASGSERITPVVNVVHIKNGISGNVYGGSKGAAGGTTNVGSNPLVNIGYDADMNGYITPTSTYLTDHSGLLAAPRAIISGSVFGGGDAATVNGNTAIFLRNKAKVFGNVYGGGNMGEVTGDTKVIVNGANN
jgi:hypothetical protein